MVHKLYKRTAFSLGLLVAFIGSFLVGSGKTFGSLTKFTDGVSLLSQPTIVHADGPVGDGTGDSQGDGPGGPGDDDDDDSDGSCSDGPGDDDDDN